MAGVGGLHPLMLQLPLRAWYRRHASQHVGFDLHLASMAKSSVVAHRCSYRARPGSFRSRTGALLPRVLSGRAQVRSYQESYPVAHRCAPTEHDPAASGRARVRS
jgi:hypothetical protein